MHQRIHWDLHQHLHFNVPLFLDSLHHILLPNWLSSSNLLIFIHIFVMNTLIETRKLQSSFPSYILYPKTVQMSFIFIDIFVQAELQTDIFIESCKKSHFLSLPSGSQARSLEQRNRHQHSSLVSRVICCFPQSCSWIFWSKCGRFKSKDWKVFHES